MHVLVCDDDPAARFVAKRWLTSTFGCTVTECEDGVQALDLVAATSFDLALIDLDLPRLNGIEVVEAIRAAAGTRDLPVVIVSQERREEVVRALLALGVSAYLIKPLRERAVVGRIGPLLALRRTAVVRSGEGPGFGPGEPAMVVDGDDEYRHKFVAAASRFGPVMGAGSGADALTLFRRSPVGLVFVGAKLGIVGPERLAGKCREAGGHVRLIGIDAAADQVGAGKPFDACIPRSVDPDVLDKELRAFARIPGTLADLEHYAPQFGACLSTAVVQVFGMMGGFEVDVPATPVIESPPGLVSASSVDVDGRFRVDLELVWPMQAVDEMCVRLLGSDAGALDADARQSTTDEVLSLVTGRLEAWLKAKGISSKATPPATRRCEGGGTLQELPPAHGAVSHFELPELGVGLALRVCVRPAVI